MLVQPGPGGDGEQEQAAGRGGGDAGVVEHDEQQRPEGAEAEDAADPAGELAERGRRAQGDQTGQQHLEGADPGEGAVGQQAEVAGELVDHDPGGVGRALLEALGEAAGVTDRAAQPGPEGHHHGGGHGQAGQQHHPADPGSAGGEHDQGRGRGQHGGEGAADVGPEPGQPVDHAQTHQQGGGGDRGQGRERGHQHHRGQGEGEVAVAEAVEALAIPGAAPDQRLGQPVAAEHQVEHDQPEQHGPEQGRRRHPAPERAGGGGPVEPEGDQGQDDGHGDARPDPADRPREGGPGVAQGAWEQGLPDAGRNRLGHAGQ